MAVFRQLIIPLFIVLVFLVALIAVSSRSFLPSDMASPAPLEESDVAPNLSMMPFVTPIAEVAPLHAYTPRTPEALTV